MKIVLGASRPARVVIPPGVVHAYKNVGDVPGLIVNMPNRLYGGAGRRGPVDETRHELVAGQPYLMD
jgi:dTDP-4-dehydrorhamnose 3,5-epimerase